MCGTQQIRRQGRVRYIDSQHSEKVSAKDLRSAYKCLTIISRDSDVDVNAPYNI